MFINMRYRVYEIVVMCFSNKTQKVFQEQFLECSGVTRKPLAKMWVEPGEDTDELKRNLGSVHRF